MGNDTPKLSLSFMDYANSGNKHGTYKKQDWSGGEESSFEEKLMNNPIIKTLGGLKYAGDMADKHGIEGLLGSALFNKFTPDTLKMSLSGDVPEIRYKPTDKSTFSLSPLMKRGQNYSGINLGAKFKL